MSRFGDCEYDGDGPPPEFWWQAIKRATYSARGQAVLRELREALLAMPNRALICGAVIEDGRACAVGALAQYRLRRDGVIKGVHDWGLPDRDLTTEAELEAFVSRLDDAEDTAEFGYQMGLARSLAWWIAYTNDEGIDEILITPEQRWAHVLAEVEKRIVATETAVA